MVLYLSIIFVSAFIISLFNILFGLSTLNCQWWFVVVAVAVGIIFEFLLDLIIAIIIKKSPNKWYGPEKKIFNVPAWYKNFAERIGVKAWKDKIWELGSVGGFSKREVKDPRNPEYIEQFLIEINKGIITHYIICLLGFTLMVVFPPNYILQISLPIAFVNMFLNLLPIVVLKYNYPKLKAVLKRLNRNQGNI